MTRPAAILISLAFIIHNMTLLYNSKILTENHPESKLVYISSVCLLLRRINWFPSILWTKLWPICFIIEILLSIIILESSLNYVWKPIEQYLLQHADDILVYIYEKPNYEWLVCSFCSGRNDCSDTLSRMLLKHCVDPKTPLTNTRALVRLKLPRGEDVLWYNEQNNITMLSISQYRPLGNALDRIGIDNLSVY